MGRELIYECPEMDVTYGESGLPMGMALRFRCRLAGDGEEEDAWLDREQSLALACAIRAFWERKA